MIDGMVTTSKRDQMAGSTRSREIQGSCQVNRWEIIRGAWETLQMSASHPWARKTSVGCLRCTNHQVFPESKYRMWLMQSPQDPGRVFRPPLWWWWKMAALPLPAAILDDLIPGNEVIQDGGRKRKGRHFPPPPQWGSKNSPYTTYG